MRRFGLFFWLSVLLGACSGSTDPMQGDVQRCTAAGFAPGTPAMAQCMGVAASSRADDNYLAQRRFQQMQNQTRQQQEDIDARNQAQEDAARARVLGR